MIINALFWLDSINKGIYFEKSFKSNRFWRHLGKVLFASNFIISSWISIKIVTNSQKEKF